MRDLPYAAWVTIQIGCDNSCAFCIVPSVRGAEVSRPFDDLVGEVEELADRGVTEVTLLGQNVNSYGRDLTRRRPLFADLLRAVGAVEGIRRVRFTSPAPEGPPTRDDRGHGRDTGRVQPPPPPAPVGQRRHAGRHAPGVHGRSATWSGLAAARAAIADLAVTTDLIVGFPGETRRGLRGAPSRWRPRPSTTAPTPSSSLPDPGPGRRPWRTDSSPSDVVAERFERLRVVVERSALAKHRARIGRVEEVLVEGPSKRDPALTTGRTGQNKLVHFAPVGRSTRRPWGPSPMVGVTGAAPHHLTGELVEVTGVPRHRTRIPVAAG